MPQPLYPDISNPVIAAVLAAIQATQLGDPHLPTAWDVGVLLQTGMSQAEVIAYWQSLVAASGSPYDVETVTHGGGLTMSHLAGSARLKGITLQEQIDREYATNDPVLFGLPVTHDIEEIKRRSKLDIPCSWAGTFAAGIPGPVPATPPGIDPDAWIYVNRLSLTGQFSQADLIGKSFARFCYELGAIPFSEV